jgi:hypothetical protein
MDAANASARRISAKLRPQTHGAIIPVVVVTLNLIMPGLPPLSTSARAERSTAPTGWTR